MNYAILIPSITLIVTVISLVWQVCTWRHQKKREETPILRVVVKRHEARRVFYIQNIGQCSVQIEECSVGSTPIESYPIFNTPNFIIGAKVGVGNAVSSKIVESGRLSRDLQGKIAKIKCKLDSGKTFEAEYTLGEEQE